MRIYISSTLTDLYEHRKAVVSAIRGLKLEPYETCEVAEASFEATGTSPTIEESLSLINESDVFVLLLGWRYGYVPEGSTKSIVELEYEAAKNQGCLMLCFVVDERAEVPGGLVEAGENAPALRKFKARISSENVLRRFVEPEGVAREVATSLIRYLHTPLGKAAQLFIDHPELQRELGIVRRERDRNQLIVETLRDRLNDIVPADPVWRGRQFKLDHTLCFCLLPFQEAFFRVYEEGIQPAVELAGLRAMHAGEIFDNREVMEDVWESICAARIVIADVSDRNPNVFYELGICHTLGKEVVILTQRASDVPFDIRHRRYIEYSTDKLASLRSRLQRTVQRILFRTPVTPEERT